LKESGTYISEVNSPRWIINMPALTVQEQ